MKLATFEVPNGRITLGIVTAKERVIDISLHLPQAPRDMQTLITHWAEWQPALAELAEGYGEWAINEVHLHAPITRPGKILGIGLNYVEHVAESSRTLDTSADLPKQPVIFSKPPTTVIGPGEAIEHNAAERARVLEQAKAGRQMHPSLIAHQASRYREATRQADLATKQAQEATQKAAEATKATATVENYIDKVIKRTEARQAELVQVNADIDRLRAMRDRERGQGYER